MFDLEEFLSENYKEKFKFPLIASNLFKSMIADVAIVYYDRYADRLVEILRDSPEMDFTYLDVDLTDKDDVITFIPSSKLKDDYITINDEYEDHQMTIDVIIKKLKKNEYRKQPVSFGRLMKKIFGSDISDKDLETLVNRWKSAFNEKKVSFVEYTGRDVYDAYDSGNYASDSGELGNSCMNDKGYLDLYEKNPGVVSVLVLLDSQDLIVGRALLWTDKNGRRLLDRIYTINNYDVETFRKYALNKGYYIRKGNNSSTYDAHFYNKEGKIVDNTQIVLNRRIDRYQNYPYMDSFKWGVYKSLYNYETYDGDSDIYFMEDTHGEAEIKSKQIDARGNEIPHHSLHNYEDSELEGGLVDTTDDKVVNLNYALSAGRTINDWAYTDNDEIVYCPLDKKWYMKDHMVWSDFNDCYIFRGSATHVLDENGKSDLIHDDTLFDWWDAHPTLDPRRKKNESAVIDDQEVKAEDYGVSNDEIEEKKPIIQNILNNSAIGKLSHLSKEKIEDRILTQITISTLLTIKYEGVDCDIEMKNFIRTGLHELKQNNVGNNIIKELVRIVKSGDYNQVIQIDDGRNHRRPQAKVKRFKEFSDQIINEDK